MSSSLNWKFPYRPEEGNRRGKDSNKKMSDRHETSKKWPFGYSSKPPHSSSSKEGSATSKSGGAPPRKKEDWEIQAISAAVSRRSASARSPTSSRHGDGAGEKRDRHAGKSTERVIPGTYPPETASAHHKSGDFGAVSWEQKPEPLSEIIVTADIPDSSSWNDSSVKMNHLQTSEANMDHDTTNSHHTRAVSPEKQYHSSEASSTHSSTTPKARITPRHSSPTHSPPPTHHRSPTTGSGVPLDLALRDMHQALTTAHALFTSYESAYDAIAGHIVKIAEDDVLDRLWQQMVRDQFSREPDLREFEAVREGLKSRGDVVGVAVGGGDGGGYSLERRLRAARKVVSHMGEIMPLVSRARKERMGCRFLVEESAELVGMLDPKVHEGLYSAGEERRWIGSVKEVDKGKEAKAEKKSGGRAQSGSKTSSKEKIGKQNDEAHSKDGGQAADAAKQDDDSGNNQLNGWGDEGEQKDEENDNSWGNDQQTGNVNDKKESGSQKGWGEGNGVAEVEGNGGVAAGDQEVKEGGSKW